MSYCSQSTQRLFSQKKYNKFNSDNQEIRNYLKIFSRNALSIQKSAVYLHPQLRTTPQL